MATNFLTKIFGSRNDRLLKQYRTTVSRINAMESALEKLTDEALKAKTQEFRDRAVGGESLDVLLPEAFAVVREGSKRVMKMSILTCNCWVACPCTTARFPKWAQARARP